MAFEVKVPAAGESINTANVAEWHKKDGEHVAVGDVLVTLETDKVSNELVAETAGILKILVNAGEEVNIGTVIASIEATGNVAVSNQSQPAPAMEVKPAAASPTIAPVSAGASISIVVPPAGESINSANIAKWHVATGERIEKGSPLVTLETDKVSNELLAEASGVIEILSPEGTEVEIGTVIAKLNPSGAAAISAAPTSPTPTAQKPAESKPASAATPVSLPAPSASTEPAVKIKPDLSLVPNKASSETSAAVSDGRTTRKKMSMLRRKIATHLVNAQQTAAILTTFNEVDMSSIMMLRKQIQDEFVKKHGVKIGFMSFFVKAVTQALKDVPQINAQIDGNDIVENHFYDIGVAVGTEKGLVVPVLRECDKKNFAQIEKDIIGYAVRAKEGKLQIEDLQGGVFTISNGGVYGSLLSTPILNPPQSGILGMHAIQERPIAVNGQVVIRPMMNLALSYDHRLVDGKEAVTFLIKIKDLLENPTKMMLEI